MSEMSPASPDESAVLASAAVAIRKFEQDRDAALQALLKIDNEEFAENTIMTMFMKGSTTKLDQCHREYRKLVEKMSEADNILWELTKARKFNFPARGGQLAGRFDRQRKKDKQLKKRYDACATRKLKQQFRATWAKQQYGKFASAQARYYLSAPCLRVFVNCCTYAKAILLSQPPQ